MSLKVERLEVPLTEQLTYIEPEKLGLTDTRLCNAFRECPVSSNGNPINCNKCLGNMPLGELELFEEDLTVERLQTILITWELLLK